MPLEIKKINSSYNVVNTKTGNIFSKKRQTKKQALKQRVAIYLSELSKIKKNKIKNFFL